MKYRVTFLSLHVRIEMLGLVVRFSLYIRFTILDMA